MTPADDLPALPPRDFQHCYETGVGFDCEDVWGEQAMRAYALAARAERDKQWRDWCVIEVAIRNPAVAEYMKHWEGRAEAAEARVKELEEASAMKDRIIRNLDPEASGLREKLETTEARVAELQEKLMVMCGGR